MRNWIRAFILTALIAVPWPAASDSLLLGAGSTKSIATSGGCSQATTFLARTSGLSGTETTAYTNFICGLVTDGLITGTMAGSGSGASACGSLFDVIYAFWTNTNTTARLNLCSTSFTLTEVSSPTFTADSGYTSGASGSLDSGFNPSTATSPNFTQNSAHISAWCITGTGTNSAPLIALDGSNPGVPGLNIYPKFTDNNAYTRVNDNPESGGFANAGDQSGFWFANRSSSTARTALRNDISIGTYGSTSSGAVANQAVLYLTNFTGSLIHSNCKIGFATIGASLTPTQSTALYNRAQTFGHAVGAI